MAMSLPIQVAAASGSLLQHLISWRITFCKTVREVMTLVMLFPIVVTDGRQHFS